MIHKKIIKNGRKLSGLWKNHKVQRGDEVGLTEQVTSEPRLEGRRGSGHVDQGKNIQVIRLWEGEPWGESVPGVYEKQQGGGYG